MQRAPYIEQIGLGFVGGFCDAVGFIALSGLFVAGVTGNIIVAAANLVHFEGSDVVPKLVMLPVFFLSIGILSLLSQAAWCQRLSVAKRTRIFLALQILLLILFATVGTLVVGRSGYPLHAPMDVLPVATVGVMAMSILSALTRITGSASLPTTIMTGNLTQAAVSAFAIVSRIGKPDDPVRRREQTILVSLTPGMLAFFAGALVAAPLTHFFQFRSLIVACGVLALTIPFSGTITANSQS